MSMKFLEIRNDDILQIGWSSKDQQERIKGKNMFEIFLETDRLFERYNYPCTLAVLSDGIKYYPKWVEHIRKHKDRYKIELHGSHHYNYSKFNREKLKTDLKEAINKIEFTFNTKITTWYPPFGRKGENEYGIEVCKELGIEQFIQKGKVDAALWLLYPDKYFHVNFHYWYKTQVEVVEKILHQLHK